VVRNLGQPDQHIERRKYDGTDGSLYHIRLVYNRL